MKRLVIARNAKEEIPDAFLEKACSQFNKSSGLAFLASANNMAVSDYSGPASKEDIQGFIKQHNNSPILIVLGDGAESLPDDNQPFVLLDDGGNPAKPVLVAAVEGEFNSHVKKESAHSPEFFVAKTTLVPLIAPAYETLGKAITKVMDELGGAMVTANLKNLPTGKGSITLMANTGQLQVYAKNGTAFKWGWVSDNCGFADGAAKEPAKSGFGSVVAAVASAVGLGPKEEEPAAAPAAIPDEAGDDDIAAPAVREPNQPAPPQPPKQGDEMVTFDLSKSTYNNQEKKRTYRHYLGKDLDLNKCKDSTRDWKDGTWPITVPRSRVRAEHVKWLSAADTGTTLIKNPQKYESFQDAGDAMKEKIVPVDPNAKPRPQLPAEPIKVVDNKPLLDEREKGNLLQLLGSGMFTKIVSAHGELIKDPAKWAEAEAKWPSFTEGMALTLDDVMKWPFEAVHTMAQAFPKAAALLILEFRREFSKKESQYNLLVKKMEAGLKTGDVAGTSPAPAAQPAAAPQLPPDDTDDDIVAPAVKVA